MIRRLLPLLLLLTAAVAVPQLSEASPDPASVATSRFEALAADATLADGAVFDARDDTGRTMDTAEITRVPEATAAAASPSTTPPPPTAASIRPSPPPSTCAPGPAATTSARAPAGPPCTPTAAADGSSPTKRIRPTT
ncbi:hypothetical protein ABTY98_07885 [Streptomyces sp. NPDC096040]|uniref:hypothetical protein n=1 Tax=Streptomyces sp. NPDC096040 TaxID=3155541 RepID=UPI00331BD0E1